MPLVTLQIVKFVNSSKTRKSKYLDNKKLFASSNEKIILYKLRAIIWPDIEETIFKGITSWKPLK